MREIKTRDLPFPSPSSSTWYIRLIYATVNVSPYFGVYKTPYKDCEKKFFSVLQKTCSARGHGCSAVSSTAWRLTGKICGLPQKETGTQDRPFTLKSETISPSRRYGRHSIVEAALLWNRRKNSAWNKEKNESAFRGCVCDWKEMLRHCDLNKLIRSTFFFSKYPSQSFGWSVSGYRRNYHDKGIRMKKHEMQETKDEKCVTAVPIDIMPVSEKKLYAYTCFFHLSIQSL